MILNQSITLAPSVWKYLLNKPIHMRDFEVVDPVVAESYMKLLNTPNAENMGLDFEGMLVSKYLRLVVLIFFFH